MFLQQHKACYSYTWTAVCSPTNLFSPNNCHINRPLAESQNKPEAKSIYALPNRQLYIILVATCVSIGDTTVDAPVRNNNIEDSTNSLMHFRSANQPNNTVPTVCPIPEIPRYVRIAINSNYLYRPLVAIVVLKVCVIDMCLYFEAILH